MARAANPLLNAISILNGCLCPYASPGLAGLGRVFEAERWVGCGL